MLQLCMIALIEYKQERYTKIKRGDNAQRYPSDLHFCINLKFGVNILNFTCTSRRFLSCQRTELMESE